MFLILAGKGGNDGVFLDLGKFHLLVEEVVAREVVRCCHGEVEIVFEVGCYRVVAEVKLYAHIFLYYYQRIISG